MENDRLLGCRDESEDGDSYEAAGTPYGQLFILSLILLCEPIAAFMPIPFFAQLVTESGVTNGDPSKIGFYVGIVESSFFVSQALFVLHWGRFSDRIGRRPVLLVGLAGLTASMLSFGFAKSFPAVVISRLIAGTCNGNIGVTKTVVAELTNDSNRARVSAIFPITWFMGATIAPVIGGLLQHPTERFALFHGNSFLSTYPYFLPCFSAVTFSALVWLLSFFALGETLNRPTPNDIVKNYGSTTNPADNANADGSLAEAGNIRAVLTRPVLIAVLNYGWLALLEVSNMAILTVFLPIPISSGGLNLTPQTVGFVFGTLGLTAGFILVVIFPPLSKRFGLKKLMTMTMIDFWLVFACFPWMHELAKAYPAAPGTLDSRVWIVVGVYLVFAATMDMGFSIIFVFLNKAAPSRAHLGTTNGLAQMVVSCTRALGPFGAASLYSISISHPEFLGLRGYGVFVLLGLFTGAAVYSSRLLPDDRAGRNEE